MPFGLRRDGIAGRLGGDGEMTADEALAEAQMNTRRYAKRQITWFRREPDVHWLGGFGDEPGIQRAAIEDVRCWMLTSCLP